MPTWAGDQTHVRHHGRRTGQDRHRSSPVRGPIRGPRSTTRLPVVVDLLFVAPVTATGPRSAHDREPVGSWGRQATTPLPKSLVSGAEVRTCDRSGVGGAVGASRGLYLQPYVRIEHREAPVRTPVAAVSQHESFHDDTGDAGGELGDGTAGSPTTCPTLAQLMAAAHESPVYGTMNT